MRETEHEASFSQRYSLLAVLVVLGAQADAVPDVSDRMPSDLSRNGTLKKPALAPQRASTSAANVTTSSFSRGRDGAGLESLSSASGLVGEGRGLKQRAEDIRKFLELDENLSAPASIKAANEAYGIEPEGTLKEQVARLISELGIEDGV